MKLLKLPYIGGVWQYELAFDEFVIHLHYHNGFVIEDCLSEKLEYYQVMFQ